MKYRIFNISSSSFTGFEYENKWNYILSSMNNYDIGHTYEWNVELIKNTKYKTIIIAVEKDNQCIAIIPLIIVNEYGIKIVKSISRKNKITTDNYDIICIPDELENVLEELFKYLNQFKNIWDIVLIDIRNSDYMLNRMLMQSMRISQKNNFSTSTIISSYTPIIDLIQCDQKYEKILGKRTKKDYKNIINYYHKDILKLDIKYESDAISNFLKLSEMNNKTWKYFDDDVISFYINQIKSNKSIFVASISYNTEYYAHVLGFENNKTIYLHPAGVLRTKILGQSPGIALYFILIDYFIKNDFLRIDMSPGMEEYKLRISNIIRPNYTIVISKNKIKKYAYMILNKLMKY